MPVELHCGTLVLGVLLIGPLLAIGNLVAWWQTRERAMAWWAAGSLAAGTAAPQFQLTTITLGYVSVALALCFYWGGIRAFQRRPAKPSLFRRPGPWVFLTLVLIGVASGYHEGVLALAISCVSAICVYELVMKHGKQARASSYFVGGLFSLNAFFFLLLGTLIMPAEDGPMVPRDVLLLAAYAELLLLLIGWNVGFIMLAMQRYLELAVDLASHDELTGVLNRRVLGERIRHHVALAQRGGATLSVLALDLDHFKQVNDTYGHQAGDEVLRAFVGIAQACLRTTDQMGRVGGEEFVALLPATNAPGAQALAERLRQALESRPVQYRGLSIKVTVSIGIAEFDRHVHDVNSLLESADRALYEAKRRGRNRVEVAPSTPSIPPVVQLVWDGSYSSGNPFIDAEHEQLFGKVNQLIRKAQEHPDVRALHEHLDDMLFWLSEHFRHEETIFLSTGWDGADRHVREHRQLETRGREILGGIATDEHSYGDVLDFLIRDVVSNHLAKEDINYFPVITADQRL